MHLHSSSFVLAPAVRRLLRRSHRALVETRPSSIPKAGTGVFARERIGQGEAICLYPGVYSAGLPPTTAAANTRDDEAVVFLGGWSTPSGVDPNTNAYILNLKTTSTTTATTATASISLNGGYLDGLALEACDRRRLDANPSAVAHLVNHSTTNDNVEVAAFDWSSVLPMKSDDNDDTKKDNTRRKGFVGVDGEDEYYYGLPNVARFDGAPRYMDGSEVVNYQKKVELEHSVCQNVCGAAFCARVDIEAGEELFLDYGLVPPIPSWAVDFYDEA